MPAAAQFDAVTGRCVAAQMSVDNARILAGEWRAIAPELVAVAPYIVVDGKSVRAMTTAEIDAAKKADADAVQAAKPEALKDAEAQHEAAIGTTTEARLARLEAAVKILSSGGVITQTQAEKEVTR